MALAGAVVSKPMPKKTTCLSGFCSAMCTASNGEYTTRTSPPVLLTRNRSPCEPGTRIMSPKEQKMTSGLAAIASARSMVSSGVTHTGHPGPWIISTSSGSNWSIPLRTIVWVCPPHTSMSAHGRVTVAAMSSSSRRASSGSPNSSRYFTNPLPGQGRLRGRLRPDPASASVPLVGSAPNSDSRRPTLRISSRVSSAESSSSLVSAKPTWTIVQSPTSTSGT